MDLFHVIGDATKPVKIPAVIAHVCNTVGAWGSGFVIPLGNMYPQAKQDFLSVPNRPLEDVSIIDCGNGIFVANMVSQEGIRARKGERPLRYGVLHTCLDQVQKFAAANGATVHMPRIGADRAGGEWPVIKSIITNTMAVNTYVYTLDSERDKWPETAEKDIADATVDEAKKILK